MPLHHLRSGDVIITMLTLADKFHTFIFTHSLHTSEVHTVQERGVPEWMGIA